MVTIPCPLCMTCAQPAHPDFDHLVCSQQCLDDLGEHLGMPLDPSPDCGRKLGACRVIDDSDHPFFGLIYQELGQVYLGSEIGEDVPARSAPHPAILRRLNLKGSGEENVMFIHVWLALVRMPNSSIVVEARWYPDLEETRFHFKDVPYNVSDKDLAKARRALLMWRQGKLKGRRLGSRNYRRDEFRSRLQQELAKVGYRNLRDLEFLPSQEDLADEFGISLSTFARYLKDYGVRWPPRIEDN